MNQVTIFDLEQAITILQIRAHEHELMLKRAPSITAANAIKKTLRGLQGQISRVRAIRDGAMINQRIGRLH